MDRVMALSRIAVPGGVSSRGTPALNNNIATTTNRSILRRLNRTPHSFAKLIPRFRIVRLGRVEIAVLSASQPYRAPNLTHGPTVASPKGSNGIVPSWRRENVEVQSSVVVQTIRYNALRNGGSVRCRGISRRAGAGQVPGDRSVRIPVSLRDHVRFLVWR